MDTNRHPMTEQDRATYTKLIEWLKQSWYGVPDSDVLLPYVAARYTPEEAVHVIDKQVKEQSPEVYNAF